MMKFLKNSLLVGMVAVLAFASTALAARTDSKWEVRGGTYLETTSGLGYNILINGINKYLNFNSLSGVSGYGFRDNSGTMEFKDSGGSWTAFSGLGGGGENPLTFTYPLTRLVDTISLAFGTTTANTWQELQTFSSGINVGGTTFTSLIPTTRQLTVAGTANQITSSAGAQDLSSDRTWTLSLPNHVIFPSSFEATSATVTDATSTNHDITGLLTFDGVTGDAWTDFCTTITGSADLCDGLDSTASLASTTGKANRVTFWDTATSLFYDDLFSWDNTNKRLGVGTSTPEEAVHIEGGNNLITFNNSTTDALELVKTVVLDDISGALPQGVCVQGNYLFMGTLTDSKLRVFDISRANATAQVGSVVLPSGTTRQIFCKGNYLFAADEGTTRQIVSVDISDKANPRIVKQYTLSDTSGVYKYSSDGSYLYGTNVTSNKLKIIDISDAYNLELLSTLSINLVSAQSAPYGRFLYIYDAKTASLEELIVVDVYDKSQPSQVGTLALPDAGAPGGTIAIKASGSFVHLITGGDDLYRIIDVASSTAPTVEGSTPIDDGSNSIDLGGRYTFITSVSAADTVQIIDTASTTAPYTVVDFLLPSPSNPGFLATQDSYIFVPDSGPSLDELRIFELPNLEVPAANIGIIGAEKINLRGDFTGGGSLTISGGIQTGGIISNGPISILNTATSSPLTGVDAFKAFTVDTNGSSIVDILTIGHNATGTTPANGIGTGIGFVTSLDTQVATTTGQIASILTDVTAATPASALTFSTKSGLASVLERMRLTATGNLGIGTTSPYAKLSVVGETVSAFFTGTTTATSTFGGNLAINGTGTTTSNGGFNISDGCYAIDGVCIKTLLTPTVADSAYTESTSVGTGATSTLVSVGSVGTPNATSDMYIRGHVTLVSESATDGIIVLSLNDNGSCTAGPMLAAQQFPVTLGAGVTSGTVEITAVVENAGARPVLCARAITQGHAARAGQLNWMFIDNGI